MPWESMCQKIMNAINKFLSLNPSERVELVLKSRDEYPDDPFPGLRCISSNPEEQFAEFEESVLEEIRSYTRLMAELGKIDPKDMESWAVNAEKYALALAVIRIKV